MATPQSPIASANTVAEIASLIGDTTRANILLALMGGRALTAGELAWHARVSPQTTSGHLAKLTAANLLAVEKQGRHRYFRLASATIADVLESLMSAALAGPQRYRPTGPRDDAMRTARTCYDHMAGRLGVAVADALGARGHVILEDGAGIVTPKGRKFLTTLDIDLDAGARTHRPLCRTCLDWSERRPHLAGRLGAALLDASFARGWVARQKDSRTLTVTKRGNDDMIAVLGIAADWSSAAAQ